MARRALGEFTLSYPAAQRGWSRRARGLTELRVRLVEEWRAGLLLLLLLLLIGGTLLMLFYLWQGWQIAALHALVAEQRAKVDELEARNEALRLQVEEAFSLKRIEVYAKAVLGMVEPELRYLRLPVEVPPTPLPKGKGP